MADLDTSYSRSVVSIPQAEKRAGEIGTTVRAMPISVATIGPSRARPHQKPAERNLSGPGLARLLFPSGNRPFDRRYSNDACGCLHDVEAQGARPPHQ